TLEFPGRESPRPEFELRYLVCIELDSFCHFPLWSNPSFGCQNGNTNHSPIITKSLGSSGRVCPRLSAVRHLRCDPIRRSVQPDRTDVHLADEFHRRRLDRKQLLLGMVDKAVPAARLRTTRGRLAHDEIVVEALVDRSDVLEIGPDDQVLGLHLVGTYTQRLLLMEEFVLDRGVGLQFERVIRLGDEVSNEAVAVESHILIAEGL